MSFNQQAERAPRTAVLRFFVLIENETSKTARLFRSSNNSAVPLSRCSLRLMVEWEATLGQYASKLMDRTSRKRTRSEMPVVSDIRSR